MIEGYGRKDLKGIIIEISFVIEVNKYFVIVHLII